MTRFFSVGSAESASDTKTDAVWENRLDASASSSAVPSKFHSDAGWRIPFRDFGGGGQLILITREGPRYSGRNQAGNLVFWREFTTNKEPSLSSDRALSDNVSKGVLADGV